MNAGATLARLVGQGLRLGVLLRPRGLPAIAGPGAFFAAFALYLLAGAGWDSAVTPVPRAFDPGVLGDYALHAVAALLAGWAGATLLRRPALWLTLAALLLLAHLPLAFGLLSAGHFPASATWPDSVPAIAFFAVGSAYLARAVGFIDAGAGRWRRLLAWMACALLWLGPVYLHPVASFWYPEWDEDYEETDAPRIDIDALLQAQSGLLERRLAGLAPQTPGKADLYVVGFAGDGHEAVFRNEIDHLERLFAQRFGADGRTLGLVNHPDTLDEAPLATLANLRRALDRIGDAMDRDEDILLLFVTTHGSEDHELLVQLGPLPMRQIHPRDLRDALDASGIRHRVVVVSACYSGGFIDALRTPDTLAIAAARADRPSFGCGAGSEITWFGRAFLAEALNRVDDFIAAFEVASELIAAWEREEGFEHSHPQIHVGDRIRERLAAWREGIEPGEPVAFVPTVPASRDETPAPAQRDP